ncbi:MAG TPA: 50S ribosomal protein L30 [Candidatus Methanoperedenaceae archaeon]|nr:50S ribosomal protein L30 [Candidatus Methanoperedenaceae archaeon]
MFAVVRLRGSSRTRPDIKDTLRMLRLTRVNHCVIVQEDVHYKGMLQKVKDYVAWGIVNPETMGVILRSRGELAGGVRLTDEHLAKNTKFKSIDELAKAICEGKASIKDIPGLKPVLRLHPPRKGIASSKRPVTDKGTLGFHGSNINILLDKMR